MNSELTDEEFWNNYWRNIKWPNTVDPSVSFDQCLSNVLSKRIKETGIQGVYRKEANG